MQPRLIKQTDIRVGITISYGVITPFKVTRIDTQLYNTYLSGEVHTLYVTIRNGVFDPRDVYIHSLGYVNEPKEAV